MHKSFIRLLALFALLIPLLAACGSQPPAADPTTDPATSETATPEPSTDPTTEAPTADTSATAGSLRVGLVTDLGRVNDGTFNEFAHRGVEQAANEFGLDYKFIETQTQADYEKNLQTFVSEAYDVIITVGFLIQDATLAAAQANPDIIFIGVDQFYDENNPAASSPNLVGLQFREDQGGFLAGAVAGMMTQSNVIGIVGGEEIPPVKKFRNSYENGARYVNPDVNILGVYVPSFIDPVAGASNAQQMIGEGADVIFGAGGPTGSGAIGAAAEAGVFVIGVDQDEYTTTFDSGAAPNADKILTSAIKRVDVAVYDQVKSVVENNFQGGGIAIYEASNEGVGIADYHDAADAIPDAVKQRMDEILQKLADGSLTTGVDPVSGDLDEATIPEAEPFEP
ncbi:MAG: BMP family ABC transporter substrate-binding protein [Chloroflexales bacterium]|nr:BMP family ABC transporter substrate-binding protein [Chloroflexales bacterium]